MATRLSIQTIITDTRAAVCKRRIHAAGFAKQVKEVTLVDVYTIDRDFSEKDWPRMGALLSNSVTQKFSTVQALSPKEFDWAVEIGFLPGVTDNVAHTAKESIEDLLGVPFEAGQGVYSSQIVFVRGALSRDEVAGVSGLLSNALIQRVHIKSHEEFLRDHGMDLVLPKVRLSQKTNIDEISLALSDQEMETLGQKGICNEDGSRRGPLSLSLDDLKIIQEHFAKKGRRPTDVELEMLAQTWSEHCKHTLFSASLDDITEGIYKTYIRRATEVIRKVKGKSDFCVSVFKDNSGGIVFDQDWIITDKVETHNSPSALDPYGVAITGIVGVNRDTIGFGMGAKPVINKYGFCFGLPHDQKALYRSEHKSDKLLSPRRIMDGVIAGVKDGGNQSGIPTPQGFCYFDERFKGKPLVFVGTVGLLPATINGKPGWEKRARPGDLIVMTGGRVGKDGIHGATFSSEALSQGSPASAVQIGDPITQKKMSDALIKEARGLGLYHSITDNGAGGLSSSVGEMAREAGGCVVHLDKVPLKYPGLAPWEIWVSESQERMTLAVPPESVAAFYELMKRRGVEATVIGEFTETGKCQVFYEGRPAVDLDLEFLHEGLPKKVFLSCEDPSGKTELLFPAPQEQTNSLLNLLSRYNLCDQSFITHQFDHEVQGGSVLKPLQGKGRVCAPATITRPVLSSKKGVVLSQGINPRYSDVDAYRMAACAIDTAIRHVVAAGGSLEHLALLDNFCWCDARNPVRLRQLKDAARACYDYATAFGTPFISGKDSMFNDFRGYDENGQPVTLSIPPTLLISSIGVMEDVSLAVSLDVKMPGDLVYVIGTTGNEMAGSEYLAYVNEESQSQFVGKNVPEVNAVRARLDYQSLTTAIQKRLVASALGVGLGGLGVALAKAAIAGQLGMDIDLSRVKIAEGVVRNDFLLFSESQSRFVVTVDSRKCQAFEKIMTDVPHACVGSVLREPDFEMKGLNGQRIVNTDVAQLTSAYRKTFAGW